MVLSLYRGMSDDTLFPIHPSHRPASSDLPTSEPPRLRTAHRNQIELRPCDLESLLAPDHSARAVWATVERLDLSRFYASIQAREGLPGRSPTDPKILIALWLYALMDGVGSARALERLCESHDAYRWICGGVSMNHHTLSDFRNDPNGVDELLQQVLAVLLHQGVVTLDRVSQDGLRVRASAGSASFRRQASLDKCLRTARQQLAMVKQQADEPDTQRSARERAARERAAREREERIGKALAELPKVGAQRESRRRKREARTSTTDPEARVMKMADGGFRPAYNIQLATAVDGRVIVGVRVTNAGSDQQEMSPMLATVERNTGRLPRQYLVDGGYRSYTDLEAVSSRGVQVVAPVKASRNPEIDPHVPKPGDSAAIAEWRARMKTEESKATYRLRAATSETVNADVRCYRGLSVLRVRGVTKVWAVAAWAALAYNVMRGLRLGVWA
jgi:transposase